MAVPAAAPVVVESAPEPPRVVTRTRGGASSRAVAAAGQAPLAGAAATSGSIGTPAESGDVEPGVADVESGDSSEVGHVPIKKKGTRKR